MPIKINFKTKFAHSSVEVKTLIGQGILGE